MILQEQRYHNTVGYEVRHASTLLKQTVRVLITHPEMEFLLTWKTQGNRDDLLELSVMHIA